LFLYFQPAGSFLTELWSAADKVQKAYGTLEVYSALDQLAITYKELEECRRGADAGSLVPLPGETVCSSALRK